MKVFSLWHGWIEPVALNMRQMLDYFCEDNNIEKDVLLSKARFRPYPELRQKFMVKAFEAGYSKSAIGRFLNLNHATVMHGIKKIKALVETAPQA